jgi:pre-mRNA-splicing factor 38A
MPEARQGITDKSFVRSNGSDPQSVLPHIVRDRVYSCRYWKEYCFGLDAESILDKVRDIDAIAFCVGANNSPSVFLCLLTKLLQISPDHEIVTAYLTHSAGNPVNDSQLQLRDLRYLRALVATYVRLVGSAVTTYRLLEPLLLDYRKVVLVSPDLRSQLLSIDEWIMMLLNDADRSVCGLILPLIASRSQLVAEGVLPPYTNSLDVGE